MNTVQSTIPLLCVLAALMLAMGPARPQDGEDAVAPVPVVGDWEDLGVSVRRCGLYSETLAHDAAGNEVLCLGFKDTECFMLLLDPYTGEGRQVTFEGVAAQIWSICAHSNGMVYATLGSGDSWTSYAQSFGPMMLDVRTSSGLTRSASSIGVGAGGQIEQCRVLELHLLRGNLPTAMAQQIENGAAAQGIVRHVRVHLEKDGAAATGIIL